jgi:hypothetical protein
VRASALDCARRSGAGTRFGAAAVADKVLC